MITVETKIIGLDAVRADLVRLLDDLGPKATDQFLRRAGAFAKSSIKKTFAAGGKPAWAPLSPETWKRRKYPPSKNNYYDVGLDSNSKKAKSMLRQYERTLYGGLTARQAKKAGTYYEPSTKPPRFWSQRSGRARTSTVPLGGPSGTFAKSVRVERLGGQQVYIGPPWGWQTGMGKYIPGKLDLYQLWKLHAKGSGRLPARRMDYLQPGDEDRIIKIAEDVVDKALKIKSSKPMGSITGFLYSDVLKVDE